MADSNIKLPQVVVKQTTEPAQKLPARVVIDEPPLPTQSIIIKNPNGTFSGYTPPLGGGAAGRPPPQSTIPGGTPRLSTTLPLVQTSTPSNITNSQIIAEQEAAEQQLAQQQLVGKYNLSNQEAEYLRINNPRGYNELAVQRLKAAEQAGVTQNKINQFERGSKLSVNITTEPAQRLPGVSVREIKQINNPDVFKSLGIELPQLKNTAGLSEFLSPFQETAQSVLSGVGKQIQSAATGITSGVPRFNPRQQAQEFVKQYPNPQNVDSDVVNALVVEGAVLSEFTPAAPLTNLYFAYQGAKAITKFQEAPSFRGAGEATLGGLQLFPFIKDIASEANYQFRGTDLVQEKVPSLPPANILEQARNRAAIIPEVVDETGKSLGVVLGRNAQGELISIGGGIDKGETPRQAALREFGEETGTISKPILASSDLNELIRIGTPEEIQNTFITQLTPEQFASLKPTSDVVSLELVSPVKFAEVTGATSRFPRTFPESTYLYDISGGLLGKEVRVTEAAILSRFEELKKINNVIEKLNPQTESTLLKAAKESLTEEYGKEKLSSFTDKELIREYLLEQTGKQTTQLNIPTPEGNIGIFLQSRYNVDPIVQEKFFNGEPQFIVSGTLNPLELDANGNLNVLPIAKRGGAEVLYFQPPQAPGAEGYLGISYILGGGTELGGFSLLPKSTTRTILYGKEVLDKNLFNLGKELADLGFTKDEIQKELNKAAEPGNIIATAKTVTGIETEVGATTGTVFGFTGEKQVVKIEGNIVNVKQIKKITNLADVKDVTKLYSDYFDPSASSAQRRLAAESIRRRTGLSVEELATGSQAAKRYISLLDKFASARISESEELKTTNQLFLDPKISVEDQAVVKESMFSSGLDNPNKYPDIPGNISIPIEKLSKESFEGFSRSPTGGEGGRYNYGDFGDKFVKQLSLSEDRKRKKIRARTAYAVLIKRRGRYVPSVYNLPRGRALKFLSDTVTNELSRQGKLVRTGITEQEDIAFTPSPKAFRTYKIRAGKALPLDPDQYIQRISANLQTQSEKSLIQAARRGRFTY